MRSLQPLTIFALIVTALSMNVAWSAPISNSINQRNSRFMHNPTFIQELRASNQIQTTTIDTLTRRVLPITYSRGQIENEEALPIQLFRRPIYAPQELARLSDEHIEEIEDDQNRRLSPREKARARMQFLNDLRSQNNGELIDSQVIEGVALTIANAPAPKLIDVFLKMDRFNRYVPDVFKISEALSDAQLRAEGITPRENFKFQFSRIRIAGVEFSQTLRYEIATENRSFQYRNGDTIETRELPVYLVGWEIDPLFKNHARYGQDGVLMNSGRFVVEPYVMADGTVDPNRSTLLYQIYIKIDPINHLVDVLHELFSESEARDVLNQLATSMKREATCQ